MNSAEKPGRNAPLGATLQPAGVNFSVFSRSATGVELLLFDRDDDARPARVIRLDPASNRDYYYWHVFVPAIGSGQIYGFRVEGPHIPERGLRFDAGKVLLDLAGEPMLARVVQRVQRATVLRRRKQRSDEAVAVGGA